MKFNLRILGSSSALPTSKRFPSAHLLHVNERFYLIDCGEGTQLQLKRFGVRFGKLNEIFISHLHGDHVFGIFGLLSSLELMGRKSPLTIFAPETFSAILNFYQNTFIQTPGFKICFVPIKNETTLIYKDKRVEVTAFPLTHKVPTFGFLFKEKARERNLKRNFAKENSLTIPQILQLKAGYDILDENGTVKISVKDATYPPFSARSYAYVTDTIAKNSLAGLLHDTDLLYHEATFMHENLDLARKTCHSTAFQAATLAKMAHAKKLLIGHFSGRYKKTEPLLTEAQSVFPSTISVNDGDEFDVPLERESE